MPDWNRFVRQRLQHVCDATKQDVVTELAQHLEEVFEEARSAGLTPRAAIRLTLQEVQSWNVLAAEIDRAKQEGPMNHRTKSLWLPALLTFLGASLSLMICQRLGMQPSLVWVDKVAMVFYCPWLATLPLLGAAGAYLSQRAHGTILARVAASLSPALVIFTVMCVILPFGLVIDGVHFFVLLAFSLGLFSWVVVPAVGLFLGALPFLGQSRVAEVGNGEKCAG